MIPKALGMPASSYGGTGIKDYQRAKPHSRGHMVYVKDRMLKCRYPGRMVMLRLVWVRERRTYIR